MSLENDLKEAFARRAEDVHPDALSWDKVETRVRRAHYRRAAAISVFTVALVAAAAVAIPKLRTANKPGGFTTSNPSQGVSKSPGPAGPAPTIALHVGSREGFRLVIPSDWRAGWFEGTYEYQPVGLPSLEQGGDTFAVTVKLTEGPYDKAGKLDGAATSSTDINGHHALRGEYPRTGSGEHRVVYRIDWQACLNGATECSSNFSTNTLEATLLGSTDQLWRRYFNQGEDVVHSIDTYDGSTPAHGTIADGIKKDYLSAALVKFLDSRIEGFNAEAFMTAQASDQYGKRDAAHGLYQGGSPPTGYVRFEIASRNDVDANSSEFVVRMIWSTRSPPGQKTFPGSYTETIGVGSGRNMDGLTVPAVVRFANLGG